MVDSGHKVDTKFATLQAKDLLLSTERHLAYPVLSDEAQQLLYKQAPSTYFPAAQPEIRPLDEFSKTFNKSNFELYSDIQHDKNFFNNLGDASEDEKRDLTQTKRLIPELALIELNTNFDQIHDPSDSDKHMSLSELKSYRSGIDPQSAYQSQPGKFNYVSSDAYLLDYAIDHFDAISKLTEGVTKEGTDTRLLEIGSYVAAVEESTAKIPTPPDPNMRDAVSFLDTHFDQIHSSTTHPGINRFELMKYFDCHGTPAFCNKEPEIYAKLSENFDKIAETAKGIDETKAAAPSVELTKSDVQNVLKQQDKWEAAATENAAEIKRVQKMINLQLRGLLE